MDRATTGTGFGLALITALVSAALPLCSVRAQTLADTWKAARIPEMPALEPVTVDSGRTALLVLDMAAVNCVESKRPSCVRSLPYVERLLKDARSHHMLVVYSAGLGSTNKPVDRLAPLPGEPTIHAPVDKFLNSDLEKILSDHKIDTVIAVGTSAEGAVLYTASGAALRNLTAIVPVDGYSAIDPFAEVYTAWHLKNAPAAISSHVTLTTTAQITMR
jgi:nicotinamidase-related amidase